MSAADATAPASRKPVAGRRRPRAVIVFVALVVMLVAVSLLAATIGAAGIPLARLWPALGLGGTADPATFARDQLVLWSIRIPRIAIAAMIGALLAVSGTIMQGLFRNPLADPALVGVSSGGALAAAFTIVILDNAIAPNAAANSFEVLPLAAFFGSLVTTLLLYRIASREGRTSVAIFLLSGLAIAALANAGLGLLIFMADDRQLRDITFWLLGSLGGATWSKAGLLLPFVAASAVVMPFIARGLDVLVLGESEAFHTGINVERLKIICIVLVSAMTGAAVAICGVIGFVGIVVPHLLRLAIGPGHRLLLPASALFGAALMVFADTFARVLAAPAEIPVGILTATIGAPFFLYVLLRQRALVGA
jgi:iron complex transport system permease protein